MVVARSAGILDLGWDGPAVRREKRRAELAEQRTADQAEAARLQSDFFGEVSHELRTPLTSILGYLAIIDENEADGLSEAGHSQLQTVGRNARRLDGLVQELLLVTHLRSGSFSVQPEIVDIGEIVRQERMDLEPVAAKAGIALSCRVDPVRPLHADPARLTQMLANLVSNAIKFTPEGGHVDVAVREQGRQCLIEVTDNGVGIDRREREKLFERFYRGETARNDRVQGVGLGLAITKAIVEAHDGTIEIDSEPGVGSTFRVRLPLPALAAEASKGAPAMEPAAPEHVAA